MTPGAVGSTLIVVINYQSLVILISDRVNLTMIPLTKPPDLRPQNSLIADCTYIHSCGSHGSLSVTNFYYCLCFIFPILYYRNYLALHTVELPHCFLDVGKAPPQPSHCPRLVDGICQLMLHQEWGLPQSLCFASFGIFLAIYIL